MDPGIDGVETLRQIPVNTPGQRAIIAGGFSESRRIRQALRMGFGPCLKISHTLLYNALATG